MEKENIPSSTIELQTPPREKHSRIVSRQQYAKLLSSKQLEERISPSRRYLRPLQLNGKIEQSFNAKAIRIRQIYPQVSFEQVFEDSLMKNSEETLFNISENVLKEKLENLLKKS